MEAKKFRDYKIKGDYVYPSHRVNPKIKASDEYCIAFCEAFMADYVNNRCETPFEFGSDYSYKTLRQYAQAREGNETAKRNFFGSKKRDKETGKYPTTITTSWEGMDVMPKMFDVMRAINMGVEYRTTTRSIDPDSVQSKKADKELLKMLIDDNVKDLLKRAKYRPSVPVSPEEVGLETEGDVDLYFDSGAYVTQREIASEAACSKTRHESGGRVIQDQIFDDFITLGIAGIKTWIDKANKVVKYRYVDPEHTIIPYSKFKDFRNITRAAELRTMTISELREEFPHISAARWLAIARDFAYMNPEYRNYLESSGKGYFENHNEHATEYGIDPVNACRILVMDAQWLSVDYEYFLTNENKHSVYKEVEFGYEVNPKRKSKGDKKIEKKVIRKYHASWIVGTKTMLDCGPVLDQVYYGKDGNKTPKLDYFFAKIGNKSLVERCIPHIEDIHLAAVKRRNAIAKIPPAPRMIVQQQLMENVWLNGVLQEPEDLYLRFIENGVLVMNNLDAFNKPIFQNSKAVEFVPNGLLEDIVLFTNEIKEGIERIREVTELNQVVDASTPNSYVGLGKSEMAASAANNALAPTFKTFPILMKNVDTDVVKKWQILAGKDDTVTVDYSPLGTQSMQTLALDKSFSNADFNIYVEMEFTEDERRNLLARIIELSQMYKTTQGAQGISTADYMYLEELIMGGAFKFAKYYIAKAEAKRERIAMRFKRESEERTFKGQQDSLAMNNKFKADAINQEERKRLLTARVTEAEKRKTKLYEALTEAQKPDATMIPNTTTIEELIAKTEAEINAILAADIQMDMQLQQTDENMSQVA